MMTSGTHLAGKKSRRLVIKETKKIQGVKEITGKKRKKRKNQLNNCN